MTRGSATSATDVSGLRSRAQRPVREAVGIEGIVTPDAVVLELVTAGVGSRICAGLIDLAIQLGIIAVGFSVIQALTTASPDGDGSDSTQNTAMVIVATLVLLGYPVCLETLWRGRTIGKQTMGLRAVTVEGAPITLRDATLRMMGGLVDRFLPPFGITGALFVLGARRHQRVGDLLAGTIVIRDPERTPLPAALWFPVPYGYEGYAATIDPTSMTDEQYSVIRAFVLRVDQLDRSARFAVADTLAIKLSAAIRHERPTEVHPETFLMCALARYQRRTFPAYQPQAWQPR